VTIAGKKCDAYTRLGVKEADVLAAPRVTPALRQIARQLQRVAMQKDPANPNAAKLAIASFPVSPYYYLHATSEPDAVKVLAAYYSIPAYLRRPLPVEAFCLAAGVPTNRVLEIVVATATRLGAQASDLIAAVAHPRVVEKTIEMALTDDGHRDRETLHKHAAFLPRPAGQSVRVNVTQNTQATAQATVVAAPPPEQTIRRLVDRFNDARALPAAEPAALPESTGQTPFPEDTRELEPVPVLAEEEEDERD
jgi:hypothetical protein